MPSDSTLPSPLSPSIHPTVSQLVAHRGDVVRCLMKLYAPSGALRMYLTIKTQIGIHQVEKKNTTLLSESPAVFLMVWHMAQQRPSLIWFTDVSMTKIKSEDVTMPECFNKQLMISSAVLLRSFISHQAGLVWLCLQKPRGVNARYIWLVRATIIASFQSKNGKLWKVGC